MKPGGRDAAVWLLLMLLPVMLMDWIVARQTVLP